MTEQQNDPSLRCKIGWHSYTNTGRINQWQNVAHVCDGCGKVVWR